jgi:hypothetical protein
MFAFHDTLSTDALSNARGQSRNTPRESKEIVECWLCLLLPLVARLGAGLVRDAQEELVS